MAYFFHTEVKNAGTAFVLSAPQLAWYIHWTIHYRDKRCRTFMVNGSLAMVLATFYIIK